MVFALMTNEDMLEAGLDNMCGPIVLRNMHLVKGLRRSMRLIAKAIDYTPERGTMMGNIAKYLNADAYLETSEIRYHLVREPCVFAYLVSGTERRGPNESHVVLTVPIFEGNAIMVINQGSNVLFETEDYFSLVGLQGFETTFIDGGVWPVGWSDPL